MSSSPPEVMGRYGDRRKLCARIDLKNATIVDGVSIDDEITMVVKGTVKRLKGVEQGKTTRYVGDGKEKEVAYKEPGEIEIEVSSVTVSTDGKFDGMLE